MTHLHQHQNGSVKPRLAVALGMLGLALLITALASCGEQPAQHQQPAPDKPALAPITEAEAGNKLTQLPETAGEELVRQGFIKVDVGRWLKSIAADSTLSMVLFPKESVKLKVMSRTTISDSITVLDGYPIEGYPGSFQLICTPNAIAGQIEVHTAGFNLIPVAPGIVRVQLIDRTRFRDEAEPLKLKKGKPDGDPADGDGQLRVLVLLPTPLKFFCTSKWPVDWKRMLELMYTSNLNKVFAAMQPTGVSATVVFDCLDYSPVGDDLNDDLNFISTDAGVAALRDKHKADMVSLLVSKADGLCGRGNYNTPPVDDADIDRMFSVVKFSCALGSYSFAHELGHNLGMQHDRDTQNDETDPQCNYGSVFKLRQELPWLMKFTYRSVMTYGSACDDCPRIGVYSNPLTINYGSYITIGPMGAACTDPPTDGNYKRANNRQQLIDAAPVVSNFR